MKKAFILRAVVVAIMLTMLFSLVGCGDNGKKKPSASMGDQAFGESGEQTSEKVITVLVGSDFQNYGGPEEAGKTFAPLLESVKGHHPKIDGFLFAGDYHTDIGQYTGPEPSQSGLDTLVEILHDAFGTGYQEVYVEGNHDVPEVEGLSPTGNNDPKSGDYGVFVIHEDDFMWYSSHDWSEAYKDTGLNGREIIEKTAQRLKEYLDEKLEAGYTKPIFVVAHLPLHYCMRTRLDGDGKYADYLFDVLNEAGNSGLNIIYLFGHDHSDGWDDYLGGSAVYLPVGSEINIARSSQTEFAKEILGFTYMNAGYVGYYDNHNGADDALTMSVFRIFDNRVEVTRYDKDGGHDLKSGGIPNFYKSESTSIYRPDKTVISGTQTIDLTREIRFATEFTADDLGITVTANAKNITVSKEDVTKIDIEGYKVLEAYSVFCDDIRGKAVFSIPVGSLDASVLKLLVPVNKGYEELSFEAYGDTVAFEMYAPDEIIFAVVDDSTDVGGEEIAYKRIKTSDELTEGKYLIIYKGDNIMVPEVVEKTGSSGTRKGFDLRTFAYAGKETVKNDFSDYEWTFRKSGNGWIIGTDDGEILLTKTSDKGIIAELGDTGNIFSISGSGKFTFSATTGVLNYNSRGLINGYANQPAEFELFKKQ